MRNKFFVRFGLPDKSTVSYALLSTLEDAVTLALAVHRSSNLPHKVSVFREDEHLPVLVLSSLEDKIDA